jgi:hypothetical protein
MRVDISGQYSMITGANSIIVSLFFFYFIGTNRWEKTKQMKARMDEVLA